jgi:hypothetical protein
LISTCLVLAWKTGLAAMWLQCYHTINLEEKEAGHQDLEEGTESIAVRQWHWQPTYTQLLYLIWTLSGVS